MVPKIDKIICSSDTLDMSVFFQDGTTKTYNFRKLTKERPEFRIFSIFPELFLMGKVDSGGHGVFWDDFTDISGAELYENGY